MFDELEIPGFGSHKQKSKKTRDNILGGSIAALVIALVFFALFFNSLFLASVGAGERGVKFNYFFGGVEQEEFTEGIHLKPPWISVTNYNIKTQDYTMSVLSDEGRVKGDDRIVAISKDGLNVGFDVTVLYHILPDKASDIHQSVGKTYEGIIIRPTCRTVIRDVAGEYLAMDMHQKRPEIADKIFDKLKLLFADKNIVLEQVLVRTIIRPPQIEQAIENKLQAEQEAQKMEFVIQKETKEAERKRIEAEGIAKANSIIGQSLTQSYLSWYWITNLDKHESVIYVPVTNQGFPIFKNIDQTKA